MKSEIQFLHSSVVNHQKLQLSRLELQKGGKRRKNIRQEKIPMNSVEDCVETVKIIIHSVKKKYSELIFAFLERQNYDIGPVNNKTKQEKTLQRKMINNQKFFCKN